MSLRFIETFNYSSFQDSTSSLFFAFCLGTLVGAERQYRQRTAGMRTNALVALGGAAFVDLAQRLAGDVESLRVIAYVVSGIGFLGAGAIIKEGNNVRGMNTAATLWCSAAVGACCGSDMVAEGSLLTFFIIAGNTLLRPLVRAVDRSPIREGIMESSYAIEIIVNGEDNISIIDNISNDVQDVGYVIRQTVISKKDTGDIMATVSLFPTELDGNLLRKLMGKILTHPSIKKAQWSIISD